MSYVAAGIAGGTALFKLGSGLLQKRQANQIDSSNPYPTQGVQGEYKQNVNTAAGMAQEGIPQQDYNNQQNNINRNQAGGIAALNSSANPGANLTSIVRAGNDATSNLNSQDAVAKNRNMLNLIQQRGILAQQKQGAWDWNSRQKYLGLLAKSQALRGAGDQNEYGALSDASSIGGTMLKNSLNQPPEQTFGQRDNAPVLSGVQGGITQGMINDAPTLQGQSGGTNINNQLPWQSINGTPQYTGWQQF